MKTKTLPVTIAPSAPRRRTKPTPSAQMSLMDLELEIAPASPRTPVKPQKPVLAIVPSATKPVRVPKAPTRVTVKADKKPLPAEPVRIVPETLLTSGAVWKMSGKHSVAYVKDAALAGELLATEPKNLAKAAMAVYYDKKGKAFAWQIRFDTARWDEVMKRLA